MAPKNKMIHMIRIIELVVRTKFGLKYEKVWLNVFFIKNYKIVCKHNITVHELSSLRKHLLLFLCITLALSFYKNTAFFYLNF